MAEEEKHFSYRYTREQNPGVFDDIDMIVNFIETRFKELIPVVEVTRESSGKFMWLIETGAGNKFEISLALDPCKDLESERLKK